MVLCDLLKPFEGYYHGLVVTMVSRIGVRVTRTFETAQAAQHCANYNVLSVLSVMTVQEERAAMRLTLQEQHERALLSSKFVGPIEPLEVELDRTGMPF